MGGNSPSHLHHDDDQGGSVTLVEGIRLSGGVIQRMRRKPVNLPSPTPSPPPHADSTTPAHVLTPSVKHLLPLLTPPHDFMPASPQETPPAPGHLPEKLSPPPRVTFHTPPPRIGLACTPPAELAPPPPVEPVTAPPAEPATLPLPPVEPVPPAKPAPPRPPPPPVEPVTAPPAEPTTPPPVLVASILLPPPVPSTLLPPPPVDPVPPAPLTPPPPVESVPAPPAVPDTPPPAVASILLPPANPTTPPPPHVESVLLAPARPPPPLCCPSVDLALTVPTHEGPDESCPPAPAEEPAAAAPPPFPEAEEEVAALVSPAPPAAAASVVAPEVFDKELRQKMKEGMERRLQEELQLQLEAMRAQARAAAQFWAEAEAAKRVKAALEADKAACEARLSRAVADERRRTEDERLVLQLYAHQLEEKEEALKRRDAVCEEHLAKLQANFKHACLFGTAPSAFGHSGPPYFKDDVFPGQTTQQCTEFYKATAESFQKGKEDTHRRFARFNIQPACGDLQSQVLKCYLEQAGTSLSCSRVASAYMQCVQQAHKVPRSRDGTT